MHHRLEEPNSSEKIRAALEEGVWGYLCLTEEQEQRGTQHPDIRACFCSDKETFVTGEQVPEAAKDDTGKVVVVRSHKKATLALYKK